jgi:hypothetical protein
MRCRRCADTNEPEAPPSHRKPALSHPSLFKPVGSEDGMGIKLACGANGAQKVCQCSQIIKQINDAIRGGRAKGRLF